MTQTQKLQAEIQHLHDDVIIPKNELIERQGHIIDRLLGQITIMLRRQLSDEFEIRQLQDEIRRMKEAKP